VASSTKEQLVTLIFIKSVISSVSGQEMSPIKHMPSDKFQPKNSWHFSILPLYHAKWQVPTNE